MNPRMHNGGVVPGHANPVETFAPGGKGQRYIADFWTGFCLDSTLSHDLFSFAENDTVVPFAQLLTNLKMPGRVGSTMTFVAEQLGLRLVKIGETLPTVQEVHDLMRYLASLKIYVTVADNQTRIAEFTGSHLMNAITAAATHAAASAEVAESSVALAPFNATAWINLPEKIGFQSDLTIGGTVKCNLAAVPASLIAVANSYAFIFVLAGRKQTKT